MQTIAGAHERQLDDEHQVDAWFIFSQILFEKNLMKLHTVWCYKMFSSMPIYQSELASVGDYGLNYIPRTGYHNDVTLNVRSLKFSNLLTCMRQYSSSSS